MAAAAILKNREIAISWSRFDRFGPNLARRCNSTLFRLIGAMQITVSISTCRGPASNLSATSFEPDSVMEFGFKGITIHYDLSW